MQNSALASNFWYHCGHLLSFETDSSSRSVYFEGSTEFGEDALTSPLAPKRMSTIQFATTFRECPDSDTGHPFEF